MRKSAVSKQNFATILIEPNSLLREGLSMILDAANFNIAVSAPVVDPKYLKTLRCGPSRLLVLGASGMLKDTLRQIELFKEWSETGHVAVLVSDSDLSADEISAIFQHGANACLSKVTTGEVLIKSLELIMLGETILSQQPLNALLNAERAAAEPADLELGAHKLAHAAESFDDGARSNAPPLSAQEKRILRCLVEGDSNKMIARKVDIAEATVKVHIKAILRKIRLQNRTQAAVWALSHEADLSEPGGRDPAAQTQPGIDFDNTGFQVAAGA